MIDERFDTELLAELAGLRPDWQFVMVGPVVKIDPESLPRSVGKLKRIHDLRNL